MSAGYGSAGERCMAISMVVAVGNAADRLIKHQPVFATESQQAIAAVPRRDEVAHHAIVGPGEPQ